ncbi:hypothetical protein PR048_021917 [Dryococelus australis]|uniref:Uncharacterized protein n=1 Tax=Dryococelus australis TaxID=614101 RepID=A0ABQ9GZN4_9NEOP|nr:hypothetical protein PR048_021917 [Dryococelus australis]
MARQKITAGNSFTLTCDTWTETNSTKGQTLQNTCQKLEEMCNKRNILKETVSVVITDNGKNIDKAAKDNFGQNKLLPCFVHMLALVASGFRKVPFANGNTEGTALRLIQAVPTRWNSTYATLEHFIELSYVIGIVILNIPESPPMLTGSQLASIKLIVQILYPLYQVTVELSAEKTPTASKVLPLVNLMRLRFTGIRIIDQDEVAKKLKECVIAGIEKVAILAMSTLLEWRGTYESAVQRPKRA